MVWTAPHQPRPQWVEIVSTAPAGLRTPMGGCEFGDCGGEPFAGELIEGCGEKYEALLGRNSLGAPLNNPCRGTLGVALFCGEADAKSWSSTLQVAIGLVRERVNAARPFLADIREPALTRIVREAAGWLATANAAPKTAGPFMGQRVVDQLTGLIRLGACFADRLDMVLARMKKVGTQPRAVAQTPGAVVPAPSVLERTGLGLGIGAVAIGALALFLLTRR